MHNALSKEAIEKAKTRFIEEAEADRGDSAWDCLQPLLVAQSHQEDVALTLVELVGRGYLSHERSLEVLERIHEAHRTNELLLGLLGDALDAARDLDMLNAPPPESELFATVVDKLGALTAKARGADHEHILLTGLATAARMMARQRDQLAESAHRRLLELEPDVGYRHYNYGLLLKTRGRFREGMAANQRAATLAKEPSNATEWNLGICATGAREGTAALEVWKRMEQKIEMGRFGLPEGSYPSCKVRLAERPLADRTADSDDPGLEETIWIERLSPCHGIIRSVLYQRLGVDYGDVVLIDGAPITYHKYGDREVPVFPHLATLLRSNYQFFDFAGTQDGEGRINGASEDLDRDSVIYSHTENFSVLCAGCWRDQDIDHEHGETEEKHVVRGRIAAPPDVAPSELLRQIDAAMAKRSPCRIYSPDLCAAAGLTERVAFERRRFDMLQQS
jgi:tetratricopeptide (TPR) repeat protein